MKVAKQTVEIMNRLEDLYSRYGGGFEASRLFHAKISRTPLAMMKKECGKRVTRYLHGYIQTCLDNEYGQYRQGQRVEVQSYGGKGEPVT